MNPAIFRAIVDGVRFRRFATVGALGAIVDLSISIPLTMLTSIPPEVAKFIGAEVAIVLMFLVNDRWTFREVPSDGWGHQLRRLIKSNVVRGGGLAIQIIVVFVLVRSGVVLEVAGTDIWAAVTMPIAIGCGFFANYLGETLLTWRAHR